MKIYLLLLLIIIAFVVIVEISKSKSRFSQSDDLAKIKGKEGESRVSAQLLALSSDYRTLNDVVLKTEKGTTQIDHIVVSKYGIFTIETKNYRGVIYGDDNRKQWTQIITTEVRFRSNPYKTYTYVTKNKFYNPVKQSIGHAVQIKKSLGNCYNIPIVPIVAFAGTATLSDVDCQNQVVYDYQLSSLIQSYRKIYLRDDDVTRIVDLLSQNNLRATVDDNAHVNNLRMAEKQMTDTVNAGHCPRCGGTLVRRNGRYGSFYGCSNYPKCKFTCQ